MAADASAPSLAARIPRPGLISGLGLAFVALLGFWLVINAVKTPSDFFEVFLIGITTGCVYALVALGYTLVYGILELINFANGDVFMLGGMFTITYATSLFGLHHGQGAVTVPILIGVLVLSMLSCGLLNAGIELIAYRPLRGAPRLAPLITAIGVSFIIEDIGLAWKGPNYVTAPDVFPHSNVFSIAGVQYTWNKLIVVLITVPVLLGLSYLVQRTRQGKAMRATAQDMDAAALLGINVNRTSSFTFLIAGASSPAPPQVRLCALRDDHAVRPGFPTRADRIHGRRSRRHREPPGRRPRCRADRADPGIQRRPELACARLRLDGVDRLLDPDPHPRVPPGGPAW